MTSVSGNWRHLAFSKLDVFAWGLTAVGVAVTATNNDDEEENNRLTSDEEI